MRPHLAQMTDRVFFCAREILDLKFSQLSFFNMKPNKVHRHSKANNSTR